MAAKPQWLELFVDEVCRSLHAVEEDPSIGCHLAQVEGTWEVTFFFSPTEVVGGEHDGMRQPCLYVVDVIGLLHVFDAIESASWQPLSLGAEDDLKGHFAIVGEYHGETVWLRVLSETPPQYGSGRFFDHNTQRILNAWRT